MNPDRNYLFNVMETAEKGFISNLVKIQKKKRIDEKIKSKE